MTDKKQEIGDVWDFETKEEKSVSEVLNIVCEHALEGDTISQQHLEVIFEEKWEQIKTKLETEGSVWYVWWMDGVRKLMQLEKENF